jgi:hypothetical protein
MTGRMQTKAELVAELSSMAGTSESQAEALLDGLVRIANREASKEFTIPGRCRIEAIRGRSRDDGDIFLRQGVDDGRGPARRRPCGAEPWTPEVDEEELGLSAARGADRDMLRDALSYISFSCPNCGHEIDAPSDMAGNCSECSFCAVPIKVPLASELAS